MEQRDYLAACSHILEELSQIFDWYSWYGHLSGQDTVESRQKLKTLFKDLAEAVTQSNLLPEVFCEENEEDTATKIIRVLSGIDPWVASGINDGVEKAAWEKYNFSPQEAMLWRINQFSPHQAYRWSRESSSQNKRYTLKHAVRWREAKIEPLQAWPSSWDAEVALMCIENDMSSRSIDAWKFDSNILTSKLFHISDPFVQKLLKTDFKPEHYNNSCWSGLAAKDIWGFWNSGRKTPDEPVLNGNLIPGEKWQEIEKMFLASSGWDVVLGRTTQPEDRDAQRKTIIANHTSGVTMKIMFSVVGDLIRAISRVDDESYWYYNMFGIQEFIENLNHDKK